MHLHFARNRQSRNKQTRINENKYTTREISTIPAATLHTYGGKHDLDKNRTVPVA